MSETISNGGTPGLYPRTLTADDVAWLDNVFKHHVQEGDQAERMGRLRVASREFARLILELCGEGPDRAEALRNVQQAAMWANASVVRCRPVAQYQ